ncbi:MAG: preprotein translocase subunit SecY [Pirellulaceae bacterium]|jgi:preprotein translocase subunit SecY
MWSKIRVIFTIPELRKKILLTLICLAIYRVGWQIQLPVIDQEKISANTESGNPLSSLIDKVALFSASDLRQATIFGLGIMPYISASIIFQLLGTVWKPIEDLKKEGEAGRKKINEYTRYVTVALCVLQSFMYVRFYVMAETDGAGILYDQYTLAGGGLSVFWQATLVLTMTCGTVFLMWLGEQIDEFGIGNGISLLIMAGILARMPFAFKQLLDDTVFELRGLTPGEKGIEILVLLAVLFVSVVYGVVFITLGQRRIPTQSAKHVRGRRVYGGSRQFLPLKINQGGVMPIIFASSLLMFPSLLISALAGFAPKFMESTFDWLQGAFGSQSSLMFNLSYVALIYFFCYFWTAITFNPKEISENLKDYGTFIPGYRPGKRTADYLEKVMVRITYVGAGFLAVVAIVPTVIAAIMGIEPGIASFYGGTGLLIAVSVAFDLVQKIDNHLLMRNYPGLLEG